MLDFRTTLTQQFPQPESQLCLERTFARLWRFRQAAINGQFYCQTEARQAQADFDALLQATPLSHSLAQQLFAILDGAGHTSSLVESINSLLKRFLTSRQGFRNQQTLQAYLDLFVLWHNMRVFQRGKRCGRSPYQIAGIDPGTTDWLTLLGFPPAYTRPVSSSLLYPIRAGLAFPASASPHCSFNCKGASYLLLDFLNHVN